MSKISLNLDTWCIQNGYVIKDISRINKYGVYDEYDVWLRTDMRRRVFGVQVDRKWHDWYLGRLKSYKTLSVNNSIQNKIEYTYHDGQGAKFYDEGLEEKLGGNKQTLGSGI
jgi:hypothetical protein